MFNRERTKEVFGYDLDPNIRRRTINDFNKGGNINKKDLKVIDNCPNCSIERQITLRASRKNKLCPKCFHNSPEMIQAKHNQKKEKSEETKQKMRENHWSKHGGISAFKGKQHTDDVKQLLSDKTKKYLDSLSNDKKIDRYIKASCNVRGISVDDFDGWSTEESLRLRGSIQYKEWEKDIIDRDKRCQFPGCLERRKSELVAHHKDGFCWCEEKRLDIDNGVLLCKFHHTKSPISFHRTYGNQHATNQQFVEWINRYKMPNQKNKVVFIVTGAPGSGKSWICSQLVDKFTYISYDDFPKESHLQLIYSDISNKPILYDPWRKATSFIKRYSDSLDIKLIVITETKDIIMQRILERGGELTDNIEKYTNRAFNISKDAFFSGTSTEVLQYLQDLVI